MSAGTVIESVKLTPAQGTAVTLVKDKDYTVTVADYGDVNTSDTDAYKGGHVTTIDLGKYVNKAEALSPLLTASSRRHRHRDRQG